MPAVFQYESLLGLVAAAVLLEFVAWRLRLPPAAALVSGGIALALIPGTPDLSIDPDLVLIVFLPPLLMSGAYFTVWREFRANLSGILMLAVGAVGFTTLLVGLATKWMVPGLPWAVCFTLGAIVSPPDAVAADAVLERVSLPSRITALLRGESLLNDAAGLVLFRFALAAALTGAFSVVDAIGTFCVLSIGGVVVGYTIGQGGLFLIRRLRDSELAIAATFLLAAIAYIGGESLHVSGVISTVTAGLLVGWHQHTDFSAATRVRGQAFWKIIVFLMESVLFIMIGLSLRGVLARIHTVDDGLHTLLLPAATVVAAVIVARFAWLLGSHALLRTLQMLGFLRARRSSVATAALMSWAGMRGVVTLVAALSLPDSLPGRDMILVSAFAVILVTVLVQGSTLGRAIRCLRLNGAEDLLVQQESEDMAWICMSNAQQAAVLAMSKQPDGTQSHPRLVEQYTYRTQMAIAFAKDRTLHRQKEIAHFQVVLAAIEAGRMALIKLHRSGDIHDRTLRKMEEELDMQQIAAEIRVSETE
ncbi:Na+/H+ antiporter [Gluconacetobacter azotocaptans]|jgi:monovalent cation/hydrogen antiporter|uniref:Na+/H+ antiporter n=1 Tax=Gluconacetobacter azotocaptans TaxID=142834 RepID=UPI00195D1337|nr:Na+/H+ antiporter [Gluconacetobacter azotocaptans]MBM9401137.1 Na+/H+ antiporter [Gluconacetobacter azotocaptans]